jgi:tRNA (guanine9-N1)-methyltransferase
VRPSSSTYEQALCKNKAQSQSIRTARLPIGIYLKELPTRKVLTVNQVVDILLKWVEYRDWRKALFDVIPMRKFHSEAKSTRRAKPENGASEVQTQGNNDVALEETLELGGKVCDGEIDSSQGDNT